MPVFVYEAMTAKGEPITNEVEAATSEEAIGKVRQMGYFPTKVREKARGGKGQQTVRMGGRKKSVALGGVSKKQLTQFTRQLSTLQDAGLPIVRSLKILEGQLKASTLKNDLIDVADDVESGSTFSEALAKHPKAFDTLYVNMVRAGEAGGVLDTILARLADFMEKSQKLKRKIIGAMIYPAVVISIATIILAGILVFIVPKFKKIFHDLSIKSGLPAPTEILITISEAVATRWYLIPGIPFGIWLLFRVIGSFAGGRYALDYTKLKIPLVGMIINKSTIARLTRTLGTLTASGVPILDALNIVKDATGNVVISKAIQHVHGSIREGENIAGPLGQTKICDELVVNMIDVGEETGELDKMLLKVADNYEDEVDTAVEAMVSSLEPIMIVVLGVTVGGIVVALFLPLVKILQEMGS
jgi:type IV pilus assembly protein PilC